MENVVAVLFEVESEAYQALAELKRDAVNASYTVSQMGLVQKKDGHMIPCGAADTGVDTADDTLKGGLIGGLIGILGGPLGVLFTGSLGALIGGVKDTNDAQKDLSMLEHVSEKLPENSMMLVALVQENNEAIFDSRLSKFKTEILRWDAANVSLEVEEAQKLEKEMKKLAKERMRKQKREERKQEWEQKQAKIRADFEAFKLEHKKD